MAPQRRINVLSRLYDDVIPSDMLSKIIERRRSPDGRPHIVKEIKRAGRKVYDYPWSKMELGDFFTVALNGRSEHAMRNAFHQGAARHDLEIAITPWKMPGGFPGFRVCVTIIGVTRWKRAAEREGVKGIRYSDGKWTVRKRKWEHENRNKPAPSSPPPKKSKIDKSNPFWADNEPVSPQPGEAAPPERHLTRAEMRRLALNSEEGGTNGNEDMS